MSKAHTGTSPLWPAYLHHVEIGTPQPEAMRDFYAQSFGYTPRTLPDGGIHLSDGERDLLLRPGAARSSPLGAFVVESPAQLEALRGHLSEQGVPLEPAPTPLLAEGAFAARDPDGRAVAFGLPREERTGSDVVPGRLQHWVVATTDLAATMAFYRDTLGFPVSDEVVDDTGRVTAAFFRSDPEHHSFAAFLSDSARLDHHSLDVPDWNRIRDWADHFAELDVQICWGPGRHGVGNNLFFMVLDPDENMVELSTELEHVPAEVPTRQWQHGRRALNLWGPAYFRV